MGEANDVWGITARSYVESSWHANEAALERMVAIAKPQGGIVLDIAAGTGHAGFAFAPHVDEVIAADTSPGMLEVGRAEAQARRQTNVRFELADAMQLPYEDSSFDGAVCRVAAHHFLDPERFLEEAYRVLKPGGYLLVVDTVAGDEPEAERRLHEMESLRDPSHVQDYTLKEWRRMVRKAGFEMEYEETVAKPLNAREWLARKRVEKSRQERVIRMITGSEGWFREYLRPHGNGDLLTFHLLEASLLLRKPLR